MTTAGNRFVLLAAAGLTAAALAACTTATAGGSADAPLTGTVDVTVADNSFTPTRLIVAPGTTVTWTWTGDLPHDVAGDGFVSEQQAAGTFTHVFDEPGSYAYVCTLHSGMDGSIEVAAP